MPTPTNSTPQAAAAVEVTHGGGATTLLESKTRTSDMEGGYGEELPGSLKPPMQKKVSRFSSMMDRGSISEFMREGSSLFQNDEDFEVETSPDGHEVHHAKALCEWPETARTLFAEVVGIGVLGIPLTVSRMGFIGGALAIIIIGLVNAWSMILFTDIVANNPEAKTFAQVGGLVGPKTRVVVGGTVNAYLFGICVVVFVSCAEALQNFLMACGVSLCRFRCSIVVLFVMLPVSQIRSLHGLNFLIIVSIVCIFLPVAITLAKLGEGGIQYGSCAADGPDLLSPPGTSFSALFSGIFSIIISYQGQVIQPNMMAEMKNPADFKKVVWACTPVMMVLYLLVGLVSYQFAGNRVPGMVTEIIYASKVWFGLANFMLFLHVIVALAINTTAFNQTAIGWYDNCLQCGQGRGMWTLTALITLLMSFLVANLVSFFAQLLNFLGAGPGMGTAYLYPIPIALYLMPKTMRIKRLMYSLAFFAFVAVSLVGLYTTGKELGTAINEGGTVFECTAVDLTNPFKLGKSKCDGTNSTSPPTPP